MKNLIKSLLIGFLVVFLTLGFFPSPGWSSQGKMKVVATTSLISCITKEVGKDKVAVSTVIPPASCPGHFDLKIQDVQFLNEAKIVFYHGWESFIPKIVKEIGGKGNSLKKVPVEGNWMIPDKQKEAALAIAKELGKIDAPNKAYYENNALLYNKKIDQMTAKLRKKTARLKGKAVLASSLQADFLEWLGLKVVDQYGRGEDLTSQQIVKLVKTGRQAHLVIDNLQSGPEAGKAIGEELGVKDVTLSNFPGGLPDTSTYLNSLEKNVDLILLNWK